MSSRAFKERLSSVSLKSQFVLFVSFALWIQTVRQTLFVC